MASLKIRAVEMVRKIRNRHARLLARKSPAEVLAFYREAGKAARDMVKTSKGNRRRAG